MNEEIKYLLQSNNLKPPHSVQTEEEVVEWLIDMYKDMRAMIEYIEITTRLKLKPVDYQQQNLLS